MKLYFLLSGMITSLKCMGKNNNSLWDTHYIWASNYISSHDGNLKIYSTTSSFNSNGIGFTYRFQKKDIVNGYLLNWTKERLANLNKKVVITLRYTNHNDFLLTMSFLSTESEGSGTSNTPFLSREIWVELKVTTEFKSVEFCAL